MFRRTYIKEMYTVLSESRCLNKEDFLIEESTVEQLLEDYEVVRITPTYYDEFYFEVKVSKRRSNFITVSICPAQYDYTSEFQVENLQAALGSLKNWVGYLDDEISDNHVVRSLQELQQKVQDIMQSVKDLPNEYFSRQEGERLRQRLDELELMFKEQMAQNSENMEQLQSNLATVTEEFDKLKVQTQTLNKRNWCSSLLVRISRWMIHHPKEMKQIAGVAVELLPPDVKQHLPMQELRTTLLLNESEQFSIASDKEH